LLTVLLVLAGVGLNALAAGWILSQVAIAFGSWVRLRSRFPGVLPRNLPAATLSEMGAYLKRGSWMSAGQIAQVMINGTEVIVIGKILGPGAVVPYVCTAKLISVLGNQPQLLMQTAGPALSEMSVEDSRAPMLRAASALTQAVLVASGLLCCIVLAINQGFVGWWVGTEQYGGEILTALVVAAALLRHWNITVGYSILAAGYEKRISITLILDAIVTVGSAIVLVRFIGIQGAAIGSLLGVLLISLPGNLSAFRAAVAGHSSGYLGALASWFWRFAIGAAVAVAVARLWQPRSLMEIALAAALVSVLYTAMVFPLLVRGTLGHYLRPRLALVLERARRLLRGKREAAPPIADYRPQDVPGNHR
jgi:O-antigen/teichoic acid export membrane protein